jgi:hypothetical protein
MSGEIYLNTGEDVPDKCRNCPALSICPESNPGAANYIDTTDTPRIMADLRSDIAAMARLLPVPQCEDLADNTYESCEHYDPKTE